MGDYNEDDMRRFIFILVGDLLREKVGRSPVIASHVKNGELLSSEYLFPLLREAFCDSPARRPIIVDGFPRRVDQIGEFEKLFGAPHLVLFFQCPRDTVKERVVTRKDGREGDNSERFDKRYKEYLELNPAVLDHYGSSRGRNKLIEINTSGETEVSYKKLKDALRSREEWPKLTGSPSSPPSSGTSTERIVAYA